MTLIQELKERGLFHDMVSGTEDLLNIGTKCYLGFDPTASSLHVGNLLPIMMMFHLKKHGHTPVFLIGDATAQIGDPSGKNEERKLLSKETIQTNSNHLKDQLQSIFKECEIYNNLDWYTGFGFLDFIRNVGKNITVSYMLSKESVKRRIETGISFTEFSYQLVQGYDFQYLHEVHGVKLQIGGSDQWGNMITGIDLINKNEGQAYALTCPLLKKADGSKFGKSESGNIWLDKNLTSPYQFYQFWYNQTDEDAKNLIKIFTMMSLDEINILIEEHDKEPQLKKLQANLANTMCIFIHGYKETNRAIIASDVLFNDSKISEYENLSELLHGVPTIKHDKTLIKEDINIVNFLNLTNIYSSKGEASRMLKGGGISLNGKKINEDTIVNNTCLLDEKYILIKQGKRKHWLINFE